MAGGGGNEGRGRPHTLRRHVFRVGRASQPEDDPHLNGPGRGSRHLARPGTPPRAAHLTTGEDTIVEGAMAPRPGRAGNPDVPRRADPGVSLQLSDAGPGRRRYKHPDYDVDFTDEEFPRAVPPTLVIRAQAGCRGDRPAAPGVSSGIWGQACSVREAAQVGFRPGPCRKAGTWPSRRTANTGFSNCRGNRTRSWPLGLFRRRGPGRLGPPTSSSSTCTRSWIGGRRPCTRTGYAMGHHDGRPRKIGGDDGEAVDRLTSATGASSQGDVNEALRVGPSVFHAPPGRVLSARTKPVRGSPEPLERQTPGTAVQAGRRVRVPRDPGSTANDVLACLPRWTRPGARRNARHGQGPPTLVEAYTYRMGGPHHVRRPDPVPQSRPEVEGPLGRPKGPRSKRLGARTFERETDRRRPPFFRRGGGRGRPRNGGRPARRRVLAMPETRSRWTCFDHVFPRADRRRLGRAAGGLQPATSSRFAGGQPMEHTEPSARRLNEGLAQGRWRTDPEGPHHG